MDAEALLKALVPTLGQAAVTQVSQQLQGLAESAGKPWFKTVVNLTVQAMEKHGPQGLDLARAALDDIAAGKPPEIDWANPRTASDLVAVLQNAEADEKAAAKDFAVKIGKVMGQIVSGLIKAFV